MSSLPIVTAPIQRPTHGVILVDLPWTRDKDPRVPLGHASLLASLRAAGVSTRSVVRPMNQPGSSVDDVLAAVTAARDELSEDRVVVGVGAYVWNEPTVSALLPEIRSALPDARIVVGGPQVSFAPAVSGLYPDANCVVRGAAEHALVRLASAREAAPISGVVWRGGSDAGEQARVEVDTLPSPFLNGVVPVVPGGFLRWETKRGCKFRCSFCQHRNPDARDFQRMAPQRLFDEIALFARAGVADIAVLDPVFTDGDRTTQLLDECHRVGLAAQLSLQSRPELTDETFLDAADGLNIRIEFGLQSIHAIETRAVQRPNNMARVERNLELVRRRGHPFEVSVIYGLPNQTLESFRETVAWCLEQRVPVIKAFPLMLLRGTELERQRDRWGLVENDDPIPQVVASTTFGQQEHAQMAALSEALRRTEGEHPSFAELSARAEGLVVTSGRFSPAAA